MIFVSSNKTQRHVPLHREKEGRNSWFVVGGRTGMVWLSDTRYRYQNRVSSAHHQRATGRKIIFR